MSKTARTDGQWQVDCDINGVPICIGRPLSLPRYDIPKLDECRAIVAPLIEALKQRVTGHPPGMLQDDSRELTAWLSGRADAMQRAREAAAKIRADRNPTRQGVSSAP
jgi:hypothetical protein